MIDAQEVAISFFKDRPAVIEKVGDRVAGKIMYGNGWTKGLPSMQILSDGGKYTPGNPLVEPRIEMRCYASNQPDAMQIYDVAVVETMQAERVVVPIREGKALMYYIVPESEPSFFFDDTVGMDMVVGFFRMAVCINLV